MIRHCEMAGLEKTVVNELFNSLDNKITMFTQMFLPFVGSLFVLPNSLSLSLESIKNDVEKVLCLDVQTNHPLYPDFEANTVIGIKTLFGNEAELPFKDALNVVLLFALGAANEELYENDKDAANEACCDLYYALKDYLYTLETRNYIHRLID